MSWIAIVNRSEVEDARCLDSRAEGRSLEGDDIGMSRPMRRGFDQGSVGGSPAAAAGMRASPLHTVWAC